MNMHVCARANTHTITQTLATVTQTHAAIKTKSAEQRCNANTSKVAAFNHLSGKSRSTKEVSQTAAGAGLFLPLSNGERSCSPCHQLYNRVHL